MKAKWSDITASQQWGILNPEEKRIIIEEYSQTLPEKHRDMFKRGAELDVFTPEQLMAAGIEEVTPDVRIKYAGVSSNVDKNIKAYDKQQDEDWLSKRNIAGVSRAIGEGLTLGGFDELYATVASPFTDKTWSEAYEEAKEAGEKFHEAHPVVDTALQIGAGVGGAVLAPGMYVGKTGLSTVGKNVGMGALAGALSGEGLEGRAISAGIGAALGGAIPGAAIGVGKAKDVIGTKILKGQYPEIYKALTGKMTAKAPKMVMNEAKEPVPDVLNALMGGKTYSQQERLGNEMVKSARKNPGLYNATKASVDANVDTPFRDQVVNELNRISLSGISKKEQTAIKNASDRIAKSLRAIDTDDVAENAINKENIIALIDDNIESLKGKISEQTYKEIKDRLFDLGMQRRVANRLVKVTAPQERSLLSSLTGSAAAAGAGAVAGSVLGGVPVVGALLGALGKEALTGSATKRLVSDVTKKTLNKTLKEGTMEAGKKAVMGKAVSMSQKDLQALEQAAEAMGYKIPKDYSQEGKAALLSIINALTRKSQEIK